MLRILFVTQDTSRSGAPFSLLHLIRWLRKNKEEIKRELIFFNRGNIHDYFEKEADYIVDINEFYKDKYSIKKKIINKIIKKNTNYNIVYLNTIVTLNFGVNLKKRFIPDAKLILHLHELETVTKLFNIEISDIINYIDNVIVVSEAVRDYMIEKGMDSEKISLIYEMADFQTNINPSYELKFTVGSAGSVDWRKGWDFFILVAAYVNKKRQVHFNWMGKIDPVTSIIIDADIRKLGLKDVVHFIGEKTNTQEFYNDIDLFILTSREDPFPLVCIEAAAFCKPVICFNQGNGTKDFVKQGGGKVVSYLDVEEMGEAILSYYNNPETILKDGLKAKEIFGSCNIDNISNQIFSIVSRDNH